MDLNSTVVSSSEAAVALGIHPISILGQDAKADADKSEARSLNISYR